MARGRPVDWMLRNMRCPIFRHTPLIPSQYSAAANGSGEWGITVEFAKGALDTAHFEARRTLWPRLAFGYTAVLWWGTGIGSELSKSPLGCIIGYVEKTEEKTLTINAASIDTLENWNLGGNGNIVLCGIDSTTTNIGEVKTFYPFASFSVDSSKLYY